MRNQFAIIMTILFLSCSPEEKEPIPQSVMKPEKFTSIMIDVQITEGMRSQGVEITTPQVGVEGAYDQIFQKHMVSEEVFKESYKYYLDRPDEMEKIYEQVLDSLSKLEAQIKQKFSSERQAQKDSIKDAQLEKEHSTSKYSPKE